MFFRPGSAKLCLLTACLVITLSATAQAQLLWDFWNGSGNLNGWTVLSGEAHFRTGDGDGMTPGNGSGGFAHDSGHATLLVQSPAFNFTGGTLDGTNAFVWGTSGGAGSQGGSIAPFANPAGVLAFNGGNSASNGLKGLAFLNTSTGQYDATLFNIGDNGTDTYNFTAANLTAAGVNLSQQYRLHYYENDQGGWGWGQLNFVNVAASEGPMTHEIGGDNLFGTTTLNGVQGNEVMGALIGAKTIRLTQNLADTFQIGEIQAFENGTGINKALQSNGGIATALNSDYGTNPTLVNDNNLAQGHPATWHSQTGAGTWIQVDLATPTGLDSLKIFGRTDCCQNRQDNFTLSIRDAGGVEIYNQNVTGLGTSPGSQGEIQVGTLQSADLVATLTDIDTYVFEIGSSNDVLTINNPNPAIFETVLDLNNATIMVELLGELTPGMVYQLLDVDRIVGTYDQLILPDNVDGSNFLINGTVMAVPEPASIALWSLIGVGIVAGGYRRFRRK